MSRYWSILVALLIIVAVSTSLAERKCLPEQWQADVVGKIAQETHEQFAILDVAGKAAADYARGMTALILESVRFGDQSFGKFIYISTRVYQAINTRHSCFYSLVVYWLFILIILIYVTAWYIHF